MSLAQVESLDHEGRGIARVEGKAVFIEGALPGEYVEYACFKVRPRFEQATLVKVLKASSQRVAPGCEHFGVCGGCSMQHLDVLGQVAAKQRVLEDTLWHIGKLKPEQVYSPIYGPTWGYRYRARLGACRVPSKGGVLIGFHEKRSSYIADIQNCSVLPSEISSLLLPLRELVASLSCPDRIPQIEVAVGEDKTVLVLRNLQPFTDADRDLLIDFGVRHEVRMWHQSAGPASARPLAPDETPFLLYSLPDFGLKFRFRPTDFTQINAQVNRQLMRRAMSLLDPRPSDTVLDLFCGLGNFTLPIARLGANVVGVEGSEALVERAQENARINGLDGQCGFKVANLFEATESSLIRIGRFDKMLIDPPREGAIAVVRALSPGKFCPRRIVYVSCNPSTLARDAAVLVHEKGYTLKGAGVANMFPQTSHVESIAVFELA